MIGTTLSHYRIESELGRGGMGVVYRATDQRLDRAVAIKVLPKQLAGSAEARSRFVREAKTASALDHPSICAIHDIGEADDGSTFMVMPFYDGQTVRERLDSDAFPPDEVRRIGAQIADGLAAAHAAGIVHRDIKPANVMLTRDGRVKILDFGVAKMAEGVALTQEGSTVGTAFYMSPEQARGEEATEKSDLWSLGVVMYEMLTGGRPFRGDYDAAAAYAIINVDPEPLPDIIPEDLRNIVGILLQKAPSDRPESAARVRDLLATPSDTSPSPAARPSRAPLAAALVAVIAVIALAVILLGRGGAPPEDEPLNAIVVLPFDVQAGPELAYLDRGMVSMLSPMLDGVAGIRAVDPKAVLGLIDQRDDDFIDPGEGRQIAAEFRAGRFILGSIARLGSQLQLSATLYDADGNAVAEDLQTVSSEEELLQATSRLMIALLGAVLGGRDSSLGAGLLSTTESFPAMKAYVQAEDAYRAGRFDVASAMAREAVTHDSTFSAAWNLAANAEAQTFGPDVAALRAAAWRHAEDAPQRLQDYIRIRREAREVGGMETIRRMADLVRRYPDDLDAMGYVADQTYHQFPRHGRSDEASIPLFLRLLQFDPDNGEYLYHLAPMLYRERRFQTLDSLYRSLPANRDLPQFHIVAVARNLAMLDRSAALDSIRALSDPWVIVLLIETHDMEAIQTGFQGVAEAFPQVPQIKGAEATSALIRGQITRYHDIMRDVGEPQAQLAFLIEAAATSPYLPVPDDSLRGLRSAEIVNVADTTLFGWLMDQPDRRWPGYQRDLSAYLAARISERLGDLDGLRSALDILESRAQSPDANWVTRNFAVELQARLALAENRPEEALEVLEAFEPVSLNADQMVSPYLDGAFARMLRARILMEVGRYEEAIQWSQSVHEALQGFAPSQLPMTYQLEAEAHERLGEWDLAVERYDRLLHLWKDADPVMQPQIDAVARRRDLVIDRLAEEG